jgi:4-oxalomesaconate tautomerase
MRRESDQFALPCVLMRGGTSKGPFLRLEDLPPDPARRDAVLVRLMGALEPRRIDGIGGVDNPTNKVAIISRSARPDADVDYLFAQICPHKNTVDTSINCGNMLSAVGPYAIDQGLVPTASPETRVRIHNVNTGKLVTATVRTPEGRVVYDGDAAIDGVPGTAAPVWLEFHDVAGAKTGRLLPTGHVVDRFDDMDFTCVDAAVPMAIGLAADFGLTCGESANAINADTALLARVERIRRLAGWAMGLGEVAEREMPKLTLVGRPLAGGAIAARYFMPYTCHPAFAVTGAVCLAAAASLPGSTAARVCGGAAQGAIAIEHPAGRIEVAVELEQPISAEPTIRAARLLRTARRLFAGEVFLPVSALAPWAGADIRAA